MFQGGDLKDQMLKSYIDQVFDKYDKDRSGTLDEKEMTLFFNDLFKSLNINIIVSEQQALEAIKSIDSNYDGNVDKAQLFVAFRAMMNVPAPPPPPPVMPNYGNFGPYGGYPGYSQYQQPYYANYQQPGYPNYMNQPNGYTYNTYNPQYPQNGYNPYMNPANSGYMNQSQGNPQPANQQDHQPFNPYNNSSKK